MRALSSFDGIFLCRKAVDMRKSINGLAVIVEHELGQEPFGRFLFVFINKQRDILKMLYWDRTGFALWYKRLEKEFFKWPRAEIEGAITVSEEQLRWLLEGYDISKMKPHIDLNFSSVL